MERILIKDLHEHIGKEITISGWVNVRRDQGKMVFFDFRDRTGFVQGVVLPNSDAMEVAKETKNEYVVSVTGMVNKRPEKAVVEGANGDIELEVLSMIILNESETPPFDILDSTENIDEIVRLKYRYLDLRTERMQKNIKTRSEFMRLCREFLFADDFTDP